MQPACPTPTPYIPTSHFSVPTYPKLESFSGTSTLPYSSTPAAGLHCIQVSWHGLDHTVEQTEILQATPLDWRRWPGLKEPCAGTCSIVCTRYDSSHMIDWRSVHAFMSLMSHEVWIEEGVVRKTHGSLNNHLGIPRHPLYLEMWQSKALSIKVISHIWVLFYPVPTWIGARWSQLPVH